MTEYRLQTDVTYYITSDQGVFFIEPARKMLTNKASSWLFRTGHKIVKSGTIRTGQEFEVEFRDNSIWVKHPKLMGGKDYFKLLDQIEDNILEIVQNVDIINHRPNVKFEFLTMEVEYGSSIGYHPYLACPGMKSYESAWTEFVRTVNIQRKPRTKKFIAGHRYDTQNFTLWCLGTFGGSIGFIPSKGNFTKISEAVSSLRRVVKIPKPSNIKCYNGYSVSDLLLIEHPGLMTDSGPELEIDCTEPIYKYWIPWINGSIIKSRNDFLKLFNLLDITHPDGLNDWSTYAPINQPALEKILRDYFLQLYISFESRDCCGHKLKVSLEDSKFIEEAKELFIYSWSSNRDSANRCLTFMSRHGIDINKIILESKDIFGQIDFGTLENILKYKSRLLDLYPKTYERSITFNDEEENDGGKIRKLFQSQILSDTVVEMLKLAQENLGLVSNLFDYLGVYQYSQKREPSLNIKLSLQNVIDYLGGMDKINDYLKEVLINEKFLALDINIKRSLVIL